MPPQPPSKAPKALLIILALLVIAGIAYAVWNKTASAPVTGVAQQMDTSSWKTYTDPSNAFTFKYPEKLPTTYMTANDWPPKASIQSGAFVCTEAGSETAQAGKTDKETINGHVYCVTKESEGAAGSIYTSYAYAFPAAGRTAILTFTVRSVQCANYDDPQKTACESERSAFDIGPIADAMAQSLSIR